MKKKMYVNDALLFYIVHKCGVKLIFEFKEKIV